jgi:hypothetical protein
VREASLLRAVAIEVRRHLRRKGVLDEVGPMGARPPANLTPPAASGILNSGSVESDPSFPFDTPTTDSQTVEGKRPDDA